MKMLKPKFWSTKNNFASFLLLPFSFLIQIFIFAKRVFTLETKFKIPLICIGNIYLGGTGKTPLVILIEKELIKLQKKPAIIKKYYAEHFDEHNLIKSYSKNLFLASSRKVAISNAENNNYNVAILDDGFQDFSIKKNFNILCFNEKQLVGNGMTIPSGPLRENLNALKRANIILINGKKNEAFEKKILKVSNNIEIFYSQYTPANISEFKNKKILAFAGIGCPENFFDLLIENNLNLQKKIAFPDHYKFEKEEVNKIIIEAKKNNLDVVTTEKDYFRIKHFGFTNIKYIKVELEILNKDKFLKKINTYL